MQSLLSVAIGFAVAGMVATAYQAFTARPISFRLMGEPKRSAALAVVPFLVFAAPFVIMRNLDRRRRQEPGHTGFVAFGTILAGFWSLMSGTVVASGWVGLLRLLA